MDLWRPPLREAANEEKGCLVVLFSDPTNPLCPPCWLLLITAHIQTSSLLLSFYSIHSICSPPLALSFPASWFEKNRCSVRKGSFDSHLCGRFAYFLFYVCVFENIYIPRVCIDSFCAFKAARSLYFQTFTCVRAGTLCFSEASTTSSTTPLQSFYICQEWLIFVPMARLFFICLQPQWSPEWLIVCLGSDGKSNILKVGGWDRGGDYIYTSRWLWVFGHCNLSWGLRWLNRDAMKC